MSEQTPTTDPAPASDPIQTACDIAAGRATADPDASGRRVRAAEKDLNCKGRGPWWYRMVYRGGSWSYFGEERLPMGTYLASDRRATVYGTVYPGELVCSHDHRGPLDTVYLVADVAGDGKPLRKCEHSARRDGRLTVTLPDGSEIVIPHPRPRG